MKTPGIQAIVLAGLLAASGAAAAQPVKCVGPDGKVRYLDQSMMGREKCEAVKASTNEVAPQNKAVSRPAVKGAVDHEKNIAGAQAALDTARKSLAEQQEIRLGGERNFARVQERLQPYEEAVANAERRLEQAKRAAQ